MKEPSAAKNGTLVTLTPGTRVGIDSGEKFEWGGTKYDFELHKSSGGSVTYQRGGMMSTMAEVDHGNVGSAHGDLLMVPTRNIVSFLDEVFDEGLKVA